MIKYETCFAMALFLTDNLNYYKISFKQYVASLTKVIFIFNDEDAAAVEKICAGLAKKCD